MYRRFIPLALVAALGLVACADDQRATAPTDPTSPPRTDVVDARSYYDDYQGMDVEMAAAPSAGGPMVLAADAEVGGAHVPEPPPWPAPDEDNVFVDHGDSIWTSTDDDRESTFALDVDTGSFDVGRTLLAEGILPDPASIRAEEWVNAFDYDVEEPSDETAVHLAVETADAPHADDGTELIRIAVSTAELADEERPPANLTFVIDTSGSMDIRDRLGLVQSSLALLVNNLRPDDTIAIVTYGDEATPVLAPTRVAEGERIVAAIDALGPGGSTNMEAGLLLGYEQARDAYREDAVNVVVLASDGVANIGVTDADVLTQQITRAGEEGIHLVTVGYGMGNYNDHLMEQLADQGDGFYSYLDTFEEAEELFVEDLTPTLTVVAGDAKAQVVFDEDVVESYRLIGYENRQLDDREFRDDTVDAGELGAGHDVTALYEVRRLESADDGASIGEVRLRWADPETGAVEEITTAIAPASDDASASLRLAAAVAGVAEVLRENVAVVERDLTLDQLAADAAALVDEGVAGADELASVIADAQRLS